MKHESDKRALHVTATGNNKSVKRKTKKIQAVMAVIVSILLLLAIPVMAWLYVRRSIETLALVQEPNALLIGEGDKHDIIELDLNNIDVSDPTKSKDVVFCVYSLSKLSYKLQLSHTTNIGFNYTIYPVTKITDGAPADVNDAEGVGYKYIYANGVKKVLPGKYLNQKNEIATDAYHAKTYQNYSNVQRNAEPLYWQTSEIQSLPDNTSSSYYINYYVLHVSWDNLTNNKETDMIYLMADKT